MPRRYYYFFIYIIIGSNFEILKNKKKIKRFRIDTFFSPQRSDVFLYRIFNRDRYLDILINLITRRRLVFLLII